MYNTNQVVSLATSSKVHLLQSFLWVLAVMIVSIGICPPMADETFFKLMREAKEKKKEGSLYTEIKALKYFCM